MVFVDPEKERQRLTERYAELTLEQLQKIAADAPELTDMARQLLSDEISRRGATPPTFDEAESVPTAPEPAPVEEIQEVRPIQSGPIRPSGGLLRRFRDLPEALLAKTRVDSSGVECILLDTNVVRLNWFWSNFLGGVKLLVDEDGAGDALLILDQPIPDRFDVEGVGEYVSPHCPQCGSLDISFEELDKKFSYVTAYIGLPIPMHNKD